MKNIRFTIAAFIEVEDSAEGDEVLEQFDGKMRTAYETIEAEFPGANWEREVLCCKCSPDEVQEGCSFHGGVTAQ